MRMRFNQADNVGSIEAVPKNGHLITEPSFPSPVFETGSAKKTKEYLMPDPREPSEQPPMPAPDWKPEPPIEEPEPDRLPDEVPLPNPDETDAPPLHTARL